MFSLFAKSVCRIQIIKHTWTETCAFVKISSRYQTYWRRENGVDTINLNHDTLENLKKTLLAGQVKFLICYIRRIIASDSPQRNW